MAKRGNPEVREWMKEHKIEVEKVQTRYDELKRLPLSSLFELAMFDGVDLTKVRDLCIAGIITTESTR